MMLGTFLQAIIAIIFIYLILALLTSELQEYVATLFEARARRLKQSIFKMLGEEDWLHQYFIDNDQLKTYQDTEVIAAESKVWLNDQDIIKVKDPKNIFLDSAGKDSIWIDNANKEEVSTKNVIVSSSNPEQGHKVTLDRVDVFTTAQEIGANRSVWLKDGTLTLISDDSKIVTYNNNGEKCIWIDNNNNAELTTPADPANPVGTNYPVFISTSTDPIPQGSQVWLQDQNIIKVQDPPNQVFLNSSGQESIWIDKVNNNTVINKAEVEQDQDNPDKGANKNSSLTKFPIYQVLVDFKAQTQYLLDETRKVLLTPDSLTEKLYEHPDIRALNQSDFRWFWILGISFTDYPSWKFWEDWQLEDWFNFILTITLLLFVICLFFQVPIIFQIALFVTFVIVRAISFAKSKKIKGKFSSRRTSYGPSYIEDPKLFADTLIKTIQQNSTAKSENFAKLIMGKMTFYTPAQSVLLQKVTDLTDLQSFTELLKTEYQAVQERSTGVYKRNAKGLSFVIGLLIAILLNADTFNMIANLTKEGNDVGEKIVNELVKNPDLMKCAPDCLTNDKAKQEQLKTAIDQVGLLPLGWDYWDKLNLQEKKADIKKDEELLESLKGTNKETNKDEISDLCNNKDDKIAKDCLKKVEEVIFNDKNDKNLEKLVSPLNETFLSGFKAAKADQAKISSFPDIYNNFLTEKEKELSEKKLSLLDTTAKGTIEKTVQKQGGWFKVIFGWLITAIALGMGAPFWFDLLGKVMNVRNAGTFNSSEQTNPPTSNPPVQK